MSSGVTRYQGPTALGGDLRRFVNLTLMLAVTEFKLRYFGSVMGYFWSLMRPLMLFGVLYVVFTHIVRFGGDVLHYPVYLLTSIVLWTYFAEATNGSVTSLVDRENLLRKVRFPRMAIPLSVALTALFNLGMNLLAVLVFVMASGIRPRLGWLVLLVLVLVLLALSTGVGMLLSALYVRFRDMAPIWDVLQQIFFYGSPVLYVVASFPDNIERFLAANPIAVVLTQMRHSLIDPQAPTAAASVGGAPWLLVPALVVAGVFVLGLWVFNRETPGIAENL